MTTLEAPILLTFKPARFEWAVVAIATVGLTIGALIVALRLQALAPSADCLPLTWGGQIDAAAISQCPISGFLELRDEIADRIAAVLPWVTVLGGAVIGSQIVSRETEFRTAQFIWALEPTRRRWFLERVGLAMVGLIVLSGLAATTGGFLAAARFPGLDINTFIPTYGQFGVIVVVRAVTAFCIGLLVGAIVGRVVPAVLLSLLLAISLTVASPVVALRTAPTFIVDAGSPTASPSELTISSGWRDASGNIYTQEEARALSPNPNDPIAAQQWVSDNFEAVSIRISGDSLPMVALRESLALLGLSIVAIGLAYFIVGRRRVS